LKEDVAKSPPLSGPPQQQTENFVAGEVRVFPKVSDEQQIISGRPW
jgi:hypothetical protein